MKMARIFGAWGRIMLAGIALCLASVAASAQTTWVQVEAHPDLRTATDRARAYTTAFGDVNGFKLRRGRWYALALGPYATEDLARRRLLELRGAGLIPADSYISDSRPYGDRFWPVGGGVIAPQVTPTPQTQEPAVQTPAPQATDIEETPREARRSESALSREERQNLQIALKWFGYYNAAIDGAFGRGTRNSMARWQADNGFDATGILTTKQRAVLLSNYSAELVALGLEEIDEPQAGIAITMPGRLVEFEGYEYPFVKYGSKDDNGIEVLLISQAGDQVTMNGLYDIMQTLEIVPLEGERSRSRNSFTLTGQSDTLHSHTYARLEGGYVKGFTLVYPPAKAQDMARVIKIMRETFVIKEGALDPSQSDLDAQSTDLVAGLELRQPKLARSGFYVDGAGQVVTRASTVASCERITLDGVYDAQLVASDAGFALLKPDATLVPLDYAQFSTATPRLRSEIAVAGYSYGGALDGPTLSYGTVQDLRGLDGAEDVKRLQAPVLDGDAGGPVFDLRGAVAGMLRDASTGGRALPEGVVFADKSEPLIAFLAENGVRVSAARDTGPMAAEDLVTRAGDMTVLVSCW